MFSSETGGLWNKFRRRNAATSLMERVFRGSPRTSTKVTSIVTTCLSLNRAAAMLWNRRVHQIRCQPFLASGSKQKRQAGVIDNSVGSKDQGNPFTRHLLRHIDQHLLLGRCIDKRHQNAHHYRFASCLPLPLQNLSIIHLWSIFQLARSGNLITLRQTASSPSGTPR